MKRRTAAMYGALALLLAACAAPAGTEGAAAPAPFERPAAQREIAAVVARPVSPAGAGVADGAKDNGPVIEPQTPALVARRAAAPNGAVIEPLPDPTELLGLDRLQVAKLLGNPSLLRQEPPAEVWLYKGRLCVLHLFLYQETPSPDYAVRYFEVRGADDAAVGQGACYASLLDEVAILAR